MTDDATRRAIDAALVPMVASIGAWGVVGAHWLPGGDGRPAVWLTTRTEIERVALETQPWVISQVQMMMIRLGVPHAAAVGARLHFSSVEAESRLLDG